jgi:hypothetical protein
MFRIESSAITSRIQAVPDSQRGGNPDKKPALAIALLLLLTLNGCGGGSDATPPASDLTPPTVEYRYPDPANGAINSADIQAHGIYVIFDEAVSDTTITNTNFTVVDATGGGAPVAGAVSYDAAVRTARFMPTAPLTALYNYTATVTTGVQDLAGNHLATPYTWQFTIAAPADVTPPTVASRYPDPAQGAVNSADIQAHGIYVVFNEAVMETTISNTNFTVVDATSGGTAVAGTVSYEAATRTARFMPTAPLTALFNYTATVTTGVRDLAGNHLANPYSWQFTIAGPTAPPPPPP